MLRDGEERADGGGRGVRKAQKGNEGGLKKSTQEGETGSVHCTSDISSGGGTEASECKESDILDLCGNVLVK